LKLSEIKKKKMKKLAINYYNFIKMLIEKALIFLTFLNKKNKKIHKKIPFESKHRFCISLLDIMVT
jgi:hypothetical protein